jgi:hypothetical protein
MHTTSYDKLSCSIRDKTVPPLLTDDTSYPLTHPPRGYHLKGESISRDKTTHKTISYKTSSPLGDERPLSGEA